MKKKTLLYFGSFNPIHRGHIALAEYAIERGLAQEVILIVSPQNPHKASADLAPEMDRFEMAEIACKGSKYPEKITPSIIEFMLERPSYTVNTLRHLKENFGHERDFSILMGADLINSLEHWREPDYIIAHFPIVVYPRNGHTVEKFVDRITFLEEAPLANYSSTEVRQAIERGEAISKMLMPEVEHYIRQKGLYSTANRIMALTTMISQQPEEAALYLERGMCRYRQNEWGAALNDFRRTLELDPKNREAKELTEMVQEILAYRYTDIYNP